MSPDAQRSHHKIMDLPEVLERVRALRSEGKRIVFTNGCYDVLHRGHIQTVEEAAAHGDFLIVAINGDESITALKGPGRPLQTEEDRAAVLAAVGCVGAVIVFSEPDVLGLIEAIKPECYVKGGDYTIDTIHQPERRLAERLGSKVVIVPPVPGCSTTNFLERVAKALSPLKRD
jgi:D-beta-D-heptose 7-phosphate kinase/D-beta-D-heptose 1-phosphate adenosyltransferase